VPGDLETILLKAAAKDPGARYATAKELADELRRFLEHKPIKARRTSVLDQAAKWSRRHRATVVAALAGLILAVAVLAPAIGWIVRDRTARLEVTEREVNRALDEAAVLQARAKWPEALEAAKRAEGILAAGAGEDLFRRVGELRKDVEMVLRLEEIWMPHEARAGASDLFSPRRAKAYGSAFREFSIDVEALEPSVAAARIRARKIRLELALAIDLWARAHLGRSQERDASFRRLLAVARAADPDEWRNRMRTALEPRDYNALNELAASAQTSDLPVQTLSLLVSCDYRRTERAQSLLRRAQHAHPDNFHINFQLAWVLAYAPERYIKRDESIRYMTAALAARPRNAATCYWLANVLRDAGRVDEPITYYRKSIALDPDFLWAYWNLSYALRSRGQRDEAKAVLRQAGQSSCNDPGELNTFAWYCSTWRNSEQRDPSVAVGLAQKAVKLAPQTGSYWNTLGVAHYRAGDWHGAITSLEKSLTLQGHNSCDWFFLAMARWQRGERDEARQWYYRAVQWMDKNKPNDQDLRRFRAEAAELLQIKVYPINRPAPVQRSSAGGPWMP
jgi:tetratricopeptide (TPR) repeat protein